MAERILFLEVFFLSGFTELCEEGCVFSLLRKLQCEKGIPQQLSCGVGVRNQKLTQWQESERTGISLMPHGEFCPVHHRGPGVTCGDRFEGSLRLVPQPQRILTHRNFSFEISWC